MQFLMKTIRRFCAITMTWQSRSTKSQTSECKLPLMSREQNTCNSYTTQKKHTCTNPSISRIFQCNQRGQECLVTVYHSPFVQAAAFGIISSSYFCNFTTNRAAVVVSNSVYSLLVEKTRLDAIVCEDRRPFSFENGQNCTIFRCCFTKTSGSQVPTVGIDALVNGVPYGSMNVTYDLQCGLGRSKYGSFYGGRNKYAFFHNNFTANSLTTERSSFSLEVSPFGEGSTGFCQATNCRGGPIVAFYMDRDCVYEKMSFINSTIGMGRGIFALVYSFMTIVKDFIIEIKEQRNWLDTIDTSGKPSLTLISCRILGCCPVVASRVDQSGVLVVDRVVPQLITKNSWVLCRQLTNPFTFVYDGNQMLMLVCLGIAIA